MFDMAPTPKSKPKRHYIKPTGYVSCPLCSNQKVGFVLDGEHYVYKDHSYATWKGARFQCRAGGQRLCELRPKEWEGKCVCARRA